MQGSAKEKEMPSHPLLPPMVMDHRKLNVIQGEPIHTYRPQGTNFKQLALCNIHDLEYFKTSTMQHIFNAQSNKETMSILLKGRDRVVCNKSLSNEFGRLVQGRNCRVTATDTIYFITKDEVPKDKKVTYGNFICDHRPLKTEEWIVRLTVGGDKL